MTITRNLILAGIIGAASFTVVPAYALTAKECSVKYQAAKTAGTLGNVKWNDFRKTQCADASPAAAAAPAAPAATTKPAAKATTAAPKAAAPAAAAPAATGLSMKECSAKYQAAKTAGTLGNVKWNDFRKTQCAAGATAAAAPAAADETAPTPQTATYKDEPPAATTPAPKGVVFPSAVSSKYSTESAGKARMQTCLEQYYANKQNNTLGGLKWIQKGGGYYSLCNSRLKG
ncbi:hypothetical protein EV217_2503 [Phyllobacterium myrsinacearum]|uniref:antifreeze protein n=1 Tax=Phyllobacterium myrsinacearum TaxID=28101 RepID=UPI0010299032|nr:antifreeze protein [Phyllobacterium myrsinacearum]RZS83758.1 hypothetical protein EV217_2503 [Phyllobacterium myrsinacearum]